MLIQQVDLKSTLNLTIFFNILYLIAKIFDWWIENFLCSDWLEKNPRNSILISNLPAAFTFFIYLYSLLSKLKVILDFPISLLLEVIYFR